MTVIKKTKVGQKNSCYLHSVIRFDLYYRRMISAGRVTGGSALRWQNSAVKKSTTLLNPIPVCFQKADIVHVLILFSGNLSLDCLPSLTSVVSVPDLSLAPGVPK